ncbi:MAG: hypothetical protein QW343_02045 [Candidatus Norongarragalinales archaeon]
MTREFNFPKRVFTPNLLFGRHADTRPVKNFVEKLARLGAARGSNPFDDADSLERALERSEWGDAVVRYPPFPDKSFVPFARQYYLFLRGKLVARRGSSKKSIK